MADKWYRIPIANSVIKVSSIEYITPIVVYSNTNSGFRVVYNNYTAIPIRTNRQTPETLAGNNSPEWINVEPSGPIENGYNATVMSANAELLVSIRNDLINVVSDNGVNLINNFPDL